MAAIVVLTLAQVIWRYALDDPLQWSEEVARYCFVWVTVLGAATLLRVSDGHPRIDTLWHLAGRHVRRALDLFSRAMVMVCSAAIAFGGLRMMQLNWEQRSPSLEVPMAWIYLSMLVAPLLGVFWTFWCGAHGCVEDRCVSVAVLIAVFLVLMAAGVPIAFALGLAGLAMAAAIPDVSILTALTLFAQRLFVGIDVFLLLAIPLFILAGTLMEVGGTARRLVDFASALVGWLPGGLGFVTVLSGMFFAGVSGSASADTAAVGSVMIPAMKRKGYDASFAAALTAGAGALGPIIPPSVLMVIYGAMGNVSVAALFLGGFVPGIIIGAGLMGIVYSTARIRNYPSEDRVGLKEIVARFFHAFLALFMPVIILGGIFSGDIHCDGIGRRGSRLCAHHRGVRLPGVALVADPQGCSISQDRPGQRQSHVPDCHGHLCRISACPPEDSASHRQEHLLGVAAQPWLVLLLVNLTMLLRLHTRSGGGVDHPGPGPYSRGANTGDRPRSFRGRDGGQPCNRHDSPSGGQLSIHRVRLERRVDCSLQHCRHPGGRHDDCSAHAHYLRP